MAKKRILVVDDEPEFLAAVKTRLEAHNFEVIVASDSTTCLEKAEKEKPDLIILDILLPGVNGFGINKQLKDKASTRNIPVIMLTALAQDKYLSKGLEEGAECFITKPFNPVDLLFEINQALAKNQ